MQQVKFKQYINLRWYYWGFIDEDLDTKRKHFVEPQSHVSESFQYTEIDDESGNEIYAGDILEYEGVCLGKLTAMKGYVWFDEGVYKLVSIGGDFDGKGKPLSMQRKLKIIGTVARDPELLEVG